MDINKIKRSKQGESQKLEYKIYRQFEGYFSNYLCIFKW